MEEYGDMHFGSDMDDEEVQDEEEEEVGEEEEQEERSDVEDGEGNAKRPRLGWQQQGETTSVADVEKKKSVIFGFDHLLLVKINLMQEAGSQNAIKIFVFGEDPFSPIFFCSCKSSSACSGGPLFRMSMSQCLFFLKVYTCLEHLNCAFRVKITKDSFQ